MLKLLTFVLCATLISSFDTCRRSVQLSSTSTCGPKQTMFNEGECLCCYNDTMNIPTIGIGFNLQRRDAANVMAKYNLELSNVLKDCADKTTNYCLTDADAKDIFNTISYQEFGQCVDHWTPGLPPVIRAAIIDVAFAGCGTLHQFVKMQAALNQKDWKTAAAELRNSNWCGQVGSNRCGSDYNCIAGQRCAGQSCETYAGTCSSNENCVCFQTSDGSDFCADSPYYCDEVPDCTSCPSSTSVCIINTCCETPVCVPLSDGQGCIDPPIKSISHSNETTSFKRIVCKQDQDCALGTVCKRHIVGSYCV